MKKKVIIGLSGGVDSSVSAFILKKRGYDVEGVFMRNWDSGLNYDFRGNPFIKQSICPQIQDFKDAQKIAEQLKINCHFVDFSQAYWDKVFSYVLKLFNQNLTPNPDVLCNNYIKFAIFSDYVNRKFKPDYIAMGHYARIQVINGDPILKKAEDQNKDQSYFLSQLQKKQLTKILFPIGDLTKIQVRKIAYQENLVTANKKDSTGICFIGERRFADFLQNYLPINKGLIKDTKGNILPKKHLGVFYYTIGQRKGLNLGNLPCCNSSPWYVVGKDLATNTLYVEQNSDSIYLYSDSALIINVIWRDYKNFRYPNIMTLKSKFRYRQPEQEIKAYWIDYRQLKIFFKERIKAVVPGQICAFYYEDFCLGAGMIQEVYYKNKKRQYV
ncbi:MAG: tRNA 2-thiouridine(34) synthase MnmA [Sweet potato little leaf phytoplasma]|uniref:tRNA-specific 2-thiouridylase MnmA n=2 Tax=Candidatus Phytoplasma TaxID=33926 RepID=A0ABN0J7Q2_PEWBP|nr:MULTISPECIES: tRNA 2-thiouridine(34) synthase MnmA [Phytoplasma]QLL36818.1 tRNA-specific 2-thiouridylase MnmA ['Echinacea purpurea' witches'-broom phytoplasma]WEX20511.1 MAG: tRNA-specific 2-thiouridylase MnmA [Candidatus Phytoplasma aurantifolia]WKV64064.1 MAG: tRNA-specific 2-thiouridylase MnmA [Candidatus Phytoplasma australasiaticum]EMR14470.1 tRNA-specific 2-thiouridylase MnmA [Peanut witches'-broom phytoplasma NTU2011]MDO7987160.1 tRNA 2-thiouridine(34) synthase MnmA [Sweet potato lit